MNNLSRVSCVVCDRVDFPNNVQHLNRNGWIVTSFRYTSRVNEVALEAIYIGWRAEDKQKGIDIKELNCYHGSNT